MRSLVRTLVLSVSFFGIGGVTAYAQSGCYSHTATSCPYNLSDDFSVRSYFSRQLGYSEQAASLQETDPPKLACVMDCLSDFRSSETACLALTGTQTMTAEGIQRICLNAAEETFNRCIRQDCGINH